MDLWDASDFSLFCDVKLHLQTTNLPLLGVWRAQGLQSQLKNWWFNLTWITDSKSNYTLHFELHYLSTYSSPSLHTSLLTVCIMTVSDTEMNSKGRVQDTLYIGLTDQRPSRFLPTPWFSILVNYTNASQNRSKDCSFKTNIIQNRFTILFYC